MNQEYSHALGRALAFCSGASDGSLEGFVERAAWELHHECAAEFSSLAVIVRRGDGSSFVGRPREQTALPAETLLGLLVEDSGVRVSCRVRDHALDIVRFIDARFRTSIVVRLTIPTSLLADGEAALWFGLQGAATPKKVEQAQEMARAVSAWFEVYSPVLRAIQGHGQVVGGLRSQISDMTAVAHDARAPIGALKYLIADVAIEHPDLANETNNLQQELLYVNRLLARFSPRGAESELASEASSEVAAVVRRVCNRFQREAEERGCVFASHMPYERVMARVSELDCERIISNIVGNAVRYSLGGEITLEVRDEGARGVVARVSDSGPGIPREVIDRVDHADPLAGPVSSDGGWGVGLVSCSHRLKALGGALTITTTLSGSCVEMVFPRAARIRESQTHLAVGESRGAERDNSTPVVHEDLVLVDDDVDHSASLERILARAGVRVKSFSSIESALREFEGEKLPRVVCDAHMPDGGAERLLHLLGRHKSKIRFAVISGESSDELMYRFAALGARAFFTKPIEIDQLVEWARS